MKEYVFTGRVLAKDIHDVLKARVRVNRYPSTYFYNHPNEVIHELFTCTLNAKTKLDTQMGLGVCPYTSWWFERGDGFVVPRRWRRQVPVEVYPEEHLITAVTAFTAEPQREQAVRYTRGHLETLRQPTVVAHTIRKDPALFGLLRILSRSDVPCAPTEEEYARVVSEKGTIAPDHVIPSLQRLMDWGIVRCVYNYVYPFYHTFDSDTHFDPEIQSLRF